MKEGTRINIILPNKLHTKLKVKSAEEKISLKELIIKILEEKR